MTTLKEPYSVIQESSVIIPAALFCRTGQSSEQSSIAVYERSLKGCGDDLSTVGHQSKTGNKWLKLQHAQRQGESYLGSN